MNVRIEDAIHTYQQIYIYCDYTAATHHKIPNQRKITLAFDLNYRELRWEDKNMFALMFVLLFQIWLKKHRIIQRYDWIIIFVYSKHTTGAAT